MTMAAPPLQQQTQQRQKPEPPPFPVKSGFLKASRGEGTEETRQKSTVSKMRCRKVAARCRRAGCGERPWFARPGARVPQACKHHKEEGEVNIYTPVCEAKGCKTRPHYGMEGARARFCSTHKLGGMVDVLNRRCSAKGCRRQPSWATNRGDRALFCKEHKEDGMVDTKHRTCLHPGCTRFPSKSGAMVATAGDHPNNGSSSSGGGGGGGPRAPTQTGRSDGDTPAPTAAAGAAKYCAAHAPAGAVNVTAGRCRHPGGCSVQPCFGREGRGQPAEFCARHRKRGMTDVRNARCSATGCTSQPCCGREGDPRPRFCLRHAAPDMVNFRSEAYREMVPRKRRKAAVNEAPMR